MKNKDFDIDIELEKTIEELKPRIEAGDFDAMCHASVIYHAQAMTQLSWDLFNKAEELLFRAADGGYPEAIEKLEGWKTLRYAFDKRVKRRTKT